MQPTVGGMEKELCVRHMMCMRIPSIIANCHVDESIDDRKKFSHVDYFEVDATFNATAAFSTY